MNHYMMPHWNGNGLASPKYGNIAIELLFDKMLSCGARKTNIIAKVFGGASQFESRFSIGERNIDLAILMLDSLGIKIVAKSVGGVRARKVIFNTYNGQVLMKFILNKELI